MKRRLMLLPFAALVVLAGYVGLRVGQAQSLNETAVIEAYAARYIAQQGNGAKLTDCMARLGAHDVVWLEITCTPQGAAIGTTFLVAHNGALVPHADHVLPLKRGKDEA